MCGVCARANVRASVCVRVCFFAGRSGSRNRFSSSYRCQTSLKWTLPRFCEDLALCPRRKRALKKIIIKEKKPGRKKKRKKKLVSAKINKSFQTQLYKESRQDARALIRHLGDGLVRLRCFVILFHKEPPPPPKSGVMPTLTWRSDSLPEQRGARDIPSSFLSDIFHLTLFNPSLKPSAAFSVLVTFTIISLYC